MSLTRIHHFEGQILSTLDAAGTENAVAAARDMVDAGSNVLCRLEGSKSAAAFAFSLSDRMVGRVLGEPTEAPIYLPLFPPEMSRNRKIRAAYAFDGFTRAYLAGTIIGFLLGFVAGRGL
jgi:hypothetical protein